MANEIQILYEGHEEWETLQVKQKWSTWEIQQCHDGDVEISCENSDGTSSLFLSREELKRVITFLQSKVK